MAPPTLPLYYKGKTTTIAVSGTYQLIDAESNYSVPSIILIDTVLLAGGNVTLRLPDSANYNNTSGNITIALKGTAPIGTITIAVDPTSTDNIVGTTLGGSSVVMANPEEAFTFAKTFGSIWLAIEYPYNA